MTHAHKQWCRDLGGREVGWAEEVKGGKIETTVIE